jgi:hypothetical protein
MHPFTNLELFCLRASLSKVFSPRLVDFTILDRKTKATYQDVIVFAKSFCGRYFDYHNSANFIEF